MVDPVNGGDAAHALTHVSEEHSMTSLSRLSSAIGATMFAVALIVPPNAAIAATTGETTSSSPSVVINEVVYDDVVPGTPDSIELFNAGTETVELSGWSLHDDKDRTGKGTISGTLAPGEFTVFQQKEGSQGDFDFGLGKGDSAVLKDATGAVVDRLDYKATAPLADWSRCPDGSGDFAPGAQVTLGSANICEDSGQAEEPEESLSPLVINEIDSSPADWVELYNSGDNTVDLTGYEIRDNSDDHRWQFTSGSVAPRGFVTIDAKSTGLVFDDVAAVFVPGTFEEALGIGSGDSIRLYDSTGATVDEYSWTEHASLNGDAALATYARCPDGTGEFALAHPTPGTANSCFSANELDPQEPPATAAPAKPFPTVGMAKIQDVSFLDDSSGLDWADDYLWAVDNGTGRFWKLTAHADGSVSFVDGWETGKRVRYAKDAQDPEAAGPDTEGITMAGDGRLYIASERDNSNKGVNYNVLLQADPEADGPDVVASQEWDLTALLPTVSANMGIEAVEWVPNSEVAGKLWDHNTGAAFNPKVYHGIANGVFFVGLENNGHVYAFVLNSDGTAQLISDIDPGIGGAMGLNYLVREHTLYVESDNGYDGRIAAISLNATANPDVTLYARPEGLANVNNEGFAIAEECADSARAAWFFQDGVAEGALSSVLMPCDGPSNGETPGGDETQNANPTPPPTDTASPGDGAGNKGNGQTQRAQSVPVAVTSQPLPRTGADSAGLVIVAALLLAAGGALYYLRRRA
jgi:LPXTG-motif cell wall-anchored protein